MTVLLTAAQLAARGAVVEGAPALRALRQSLRDDLAPLLQGGAPWIPPDKARMTRRGGRCPTHGALLDFDPWQPRAHRCPVCGTVHREEEHYRWWIMNYQLWLAERAVHAAAIDALTPDPACRALSEAILRGYAQAYDRWPNRDNVLGPTRPFFSTYLESIWLLQLAVALDLLEGGDGPGALGDEVRERLLAPSASLIASYDEGRSNRQVYNNAALAAAGALLRDESLVGQALLGPSGIGALASTALLADGTWYEGENYHLFAHRGLWYGVTIADALGVALPAEARRRVAEGFSTPFATALPDFTFPARRDSQYRVSLRQWRVAESCELGLARADDPRLLSALAVLYGDGLPPGDSGRARSTAEAERNRPPVRLDRSSLGWKGLLCARAQLPGLAGHVAQSVHLAGQGVAVFRRDAARTYVALDYGESGGGHGHPDRLNLWLVTGDARVLEDVGTGSYVDPSLHWYRSTLAHNAPLVDGRSQERASGSLDLCAEDGEQGIVSARAVIAPGVEVTRTVVTMDGYLVDHVRWSADRDITFDLPWHADLSLASPRPWRTAALDGGRGTEDGFAFVSECEVARGEGGECFSATVGEAAVRAWFHCDAPHEWWRCQAPGPPGQGRRPFLLLRASGGTGTIRSVWSWGAAVDRVEFAPGEIDVLRPGGGDRERHRRDPRAWRVERHPAGTSLERRWPLPAPDQTAAPPPVAAARSDAGAKEGARCEGGGGSASSAAGASPPPPPRAVVLHPIVTLPDAAGALAEGALDAADGAVRFELAREDYRRSEPTWEEAGGPTARVALAATATHLVVDLSVHKGSPSFAPPRAENPLDNEHPDTNSDGVQLYLGAPAGTRWLHAWLLVPEGDRGAVRVTPREAARTAGEVALAARARLTPAGWALRATVPRERLGDRFTLALVINEITPDRERRRGQLVLGGARGEWVYLRGDRHDPARSIHLQLADA